MARTLNGNLTGKAAQGTDELAPVEMPYKERLHIAGERVKELIGNEADFLHLVININSARLLDTFEQIISQCDEYERERQAAEIANDAAWLDSGEIPQFGPQEPPQDYRIFNRKQADGTYRQLSEFFDKAAENISQDLPRSLPHRWDERTPELVDVTANFNGIRATASATWAARHLNG